MLTGKNVLVAGASGYLGMFAVREFKSQDCRVRALARSPHKLDHLGNAIDDLVIGKVTSSQSITGICDGIDVVFSSIGITRQKDGLTYMEVDYQGNVNLLNEARKAGVSKFIYISVYNADKMKNLKVVHAKLRFEEALKKSGLDYAIIRPNGFFSDMLNYLQMAQKGGGYVFGSGELRINPIHGRDLARVCADAVMKKEHEINVGGPDVLTHKEILALAFEACSKPLKIHRIPTWSKNIILKGAKILAPAMLYGQLEFFMTVLSMDMVAPQYGECHLRDFFMENTDNH
jgi:uncharacterized protein YbjT (DUF2867 family)